MPRTASPPRTAWPLRLAIGLFAAITGFVILALTGYTSLLDDIKLFGLYAGGAALLAGWAAIWVVDEANPLPRAVWLSYAAFVALGALSSLLTTDTCRWLGWPYFLYYIASFGFVLLPAAAIRSRRLMEIVLKFWVLIALITTTLGFIHYSGSLELVRTMLYGNQSPAREDMIYSLLETFISNRSMLSTILNVQFFGNFLLMLLPVCVANAICMFVEVKRRLNAREDIIDALIWMTISGLAGALSLAAIFTTFSKSSIFFIPLSLLGFLAGIHLFAGVRRIPHLFTILACSAIMAGTVLYLTWGDLKTQIVDIDDSARPREMIFAGAIGMFQDKPLLGWGPGSFRIMFPTYRSPDYHLTRISNVTAYAHNWVLDFLAENGILGTIAYLVFIGGTFWCAWRALRQSTEFTVKVAIIACAIGTVSLLAGSLVTPMTRWPIGTVSLNAMLGTLLGISLFSLRGAPDPNRRPLPDDRINLRLWVLGALIAFTLWITWWSWILFRASMVHNEGLKRTELPEQFFADNALETSEEFRDLFTRGVAYFEEALALDPTRLTTYYKLANAYNRLGFVEKSLATYQALSAYSPDYSEIHFNLGVMHYNYALKIEEDLTNSKSGTTKTIQDVRTHFAKSVTAFERACNLSNKISVNSIAGSCLMAAASRWPKDSPEARDLFRRAGERFLRVADLPVATVIQEENQVQREEEQRFRALRQAVDAFEEARMPREAATAAEKSFLRNPSSGQALRDAVALHIKADQPDQAMRVIDSALTTNPLGTEALWLRFQTLVSIGRPADATLQAKMLLVLHSKLHHDGLEFLSGIQRQELRRWLQRPGADTERNP